MIKIGSGDNGEITFLDMLAILSFSIGVANYEENLTQSDKQEIVQSLSEQSRSALHDIHKHLSIQDMKIDHIIRLLEEKK